MRFVLILVAIAAGVGSALQSGSNSTLQKTLQSPLWTMVLISAVLIVAGAVTAAVGGGAPPAAARIAMAPWWAWLGGLFSLLFLYATVVVSPQLGAGTFVAMVVTASTVTSIAMDHFGLLGFEVHHAGIGRIAGAVLMIAGVSCIAAF